MRLFILSLLALVCFAGDPPTQPQPPEVIQALAAYEKSVVAARKVYDAAEAKARGDAVAALQKVQEAYLKKGDLEGAVLVKDAAKKVNAGETLVLVEENIKKVQDLLGTSAPSIVGKWKYFYVSSKSKIIEFAEGNKIINGANDNENSWRIIDGKLEILTSSGVVGRRFSWDGVKWKVSDVKGVKYPNVDSYLIRE